MAVLSDKQFKAMLDMIRLTIDETLDHKLDEKLKYLPTKNEFYKSQDKIMKELKTIREEHKVLSGRTSRNSDRLDRVEEHLLLSPLD